MAAMRVRRWFGPRVVAGRSGVAWAAGLAAGVVIVGTARAAVDPYDPAFTVPTFYGAANTTYQEWNGFTSPAGPNPATAVTNAYGTPNWYDRTAAADGAFDIGAAPTAHIYSFSGTLNPEVDVPAPTTATIGSVAPAATTTLILQAEVLGSPLDDALFGVTYAGSVGAVAPTSISAVNVGSSGSGFGGGDYVYDVQWDGLPQAATYAVDYSPGTTSSSQEYARVDTLTSVPEPTSAAVVALAGMAGLRRRRRRRRRA